MTNDITTDRGVYVRELQTYLRAIQRDRTGSTLVPVDGIYGSRTAAAVREFQKEEGLPVTGTVDSATWEAAYLAYLDILEKSAAPTPIQGYRDPQVALVPGDRGDGVAFLQIMLRRLAQRFAQIPAEEAITGVYTPQTAMAVAAVQARSALPETGLTDKATWDAITKLYNREAPT